MTSVRPRTPIVLAAGLRSPFARAGGAYRRENAAHLGAHVAREVLARNGVPAADLDEVIVGCVGPPHDQANVARVLALRAGVPWSVPARTVARNCASGMEAVTSAISSIEAGEGSLYLCVGVEVMSAYPLLFGRKMTDFFGRMMRAKSLFARLGVLSSFRPAHLAPRIALSEGLHDPTCGLIMGSTAEKIAREHGITRAEADQYALDSHERAKRARETYRFDREIIPHMPLEARAGTRSIKADDGIREQQSLAALAKMRPYFEKPDGTVTIGNSCGITDGAVALIICTEERAQELGIEALARIRSYAWAGLDPSRMGLGPVFASHAALQAGDCTLADMDVVELNEAFAAQVLACARAFESVEFAKNELGRDTAVGTLNLEETNVNGGAIALGHPVGATGARLLLTAAHELIERDKQLALATLCIGGGQGGAVILERASA